MAANILFLFCYLKYEKRAGGRAQCSSALPLCYRLIFLVFFLLCKNAQIENAQQYRLPEARAQLPEGA